MTIRALVGFGLLAPLAAHAWPVDWVHDVEPGKEKFVTLSRVDWAEVDDEKTAQVEWVAASNELVLSGLKEGRALVLLGGEGRVAAWRVRVGRKPLTDDALFTAAKKACPDLTATPLEDVKLTVTVKTDACRTALLTLFQTDAFEARHLEVTFDAAALQGQLRQVQAALDKAAKGKVKARYVGAGLVLEGPKLSVAEHRAVLWAVLRNTIGRFALDDRIEVDSVAAADAGAPLKAPVSGSHQ